MSYCWYGLLIGVLIFSLVCVFVVDLKKLTKGNLNDTLTDFGFGSFVGKENEKADDQLNATE